MTTATATTTLYRYYFGPDARGQEIVRTFNDPRACYAVIDRIDGYTREMPLQTPDDGLDVLVCPASEEAFRQSDDDLRWVSAGPKSVAPVVIMMNGAQVYWGQQRMVLVAVPERVNLYLDALLDFGYHEGALRAIENAVRQAWGDIEMDAPLAHRITITDRDRFDELGQRATTTVQQRLHLARLEPHFYGPQPHLQPLANQLLERLRERGRIEDRIEILQGQLETITQTYEMASQRRSDFEHARRSHTLEWGIIVLLLAETAILLLDLLWTLEKT